MKAIYLAVAALLLSSIAAAQDADCDRNALNVAVNELSVKVKAITSDGEAYLKRSLDKLSVIKGWKRKEKEGYLQSLLSIPEVSDVQASQNSIIAAYGKLISNVSAANTCEIMKTAFPMFDKSIELRQKQWEIIRAKVESDLSAATNASNKAFKADVPEGTRP